MAVFASDNFTDTDAVNLQDHTPSGGGSWTKGIGDGSDNISINSNRAKANASGSNGFSWYYHSEDPSTAEYDIQYTLRADGGGGLPTIGIFGRGSTTAQTGYLYWPTSVHTLYKTSSGSYTDIGSWSTGPASGDVIKLELTDATKKVFVNGVERISSSDNAVTQVGKAGLRCFSASGSAYGLADDWQAEETGASGFSMDAAVGAFTLTGVDAGLTATRLLDAATGSYTLTGVDAGTYFGGLLDASTGAFTLTGNDVSLDYTPTGGYTMPAETGAFTLTGVDAGLTVARKLDADTGAFTYTGNDATFQRGIVMAADTGSFTLSGLDAAFPVTRVLQAETGEYTLTGRAAQLDWSGATPTESKIFISLDSGEVFYRVTGNYLIKL